MIEIYNKRSSCGKDIWRRQSRFCGGIIMKSPLIDTLFLSDKRKNLLMLLLEGPQTSDDIKDKLDVNWGAMIPQIKKMQEWDLVRTEDRVYRLTDMGYSIAVNSKRLLDLLNVYEANYDYLATHNLDVVPKHLLERIGEIDPCHVVESDLAHVFDANEEVVAALGGAKECITVTTFFQPQYNEMYNKMIRSGCDLTFVYSESVWERVKASYVYEDGKEYNPATFLDWMNCRIFVIPDGMGILEVSITNEAVLLCFFDMANRFDSRYLLGGSESSRKWAYDFYREVIGNAMVRIETNVKD